MEEIVRSLPEHFGALAAQLGDRLLSAAIRSEDLSSLSAVRFYTGQSRLVSGLVYIGSQQQLLTKKSLYVYKGATVIACEATHSLLAGDDRFREATVVEVAVSGAVVFNALSRILGTSAYTPPMETRGGLAWTWDQILSSKLLASQDIYDALLNSGLQVNTFFRVVTVVLRHPSAWDDKLLALRGRLEKLLPDISFVARNRVLTALVFSSDRSRKPDWSEEEVCRVLEEFGAVLMTGHQSRDYAMVRTLSLICQRCLEVAMNMTGESAGPIYDIDDYSMYYAIDMCAQRCAQVFGHMDILLLVHPSVVALRRYDQAEGADYLDVLEQYLRCNGSIAKTAEALYVHRNTINNKLSRIRQMLEMDLEEGGVRQLLLFSCQTLRYYEQILNGVIRK